MKHEALLTEVLAALREGRPAKVLGPRRTVVNAHPPGTARYPLDSHGNWDTRRGCTFVGRPPGEPRSWDYTLGQDDEYAQDLAAWKSLCARVRPWATKDGEEVVYFDTEPEAAAYADDVARKAGYVLVDNPEEP